MTSIASREARLRELHPFVDEARQMQGWTFAHEPLPLGPPLPWDYEGRAQQLVHDAASLFDMGTGGGEVLERILDGFQGQAVATEEWTPNAPVAASRLRPLGVDVVQADSRKLPFAAESFDLALDRHEALLPAEAARILRPGARLLTQQVHPDYHHELRKFFPRMTVFEPHEDPRYLLEAHKPG
jgi:SAM-dependent methyltransferase